MLRWTYMVLRVLVTLACLVATASAAGRVLYANDDDWDWAAPANADTPSPLGEMYGRMTWSALDWLSEGLPEVRGLVIGTMPHSDEYRIDQLAKLRHERWSELPATAGQVARVVASKTPPNVVVMMKYSSTDPEPELSREDAVALDAFLAHGGRLMVLDDWGIYSGVLYRLLGRSGRPEGALDNGTLDELAAVAHAEARAIVRDGDHVEGRALLMRVPTRPATLQRP